MKKQGKPVKGTLFSEYNMSGDGFPFSQQYKNARFGMYIGPPTEEDRVATEQITNSLSGAYIDKSTQLPKTKSVPFTRNYTPQFGESGSGSMFQDDYGIPRSDAEMDGLMLRQQMDSATKAMPTGKQDISGLDFNVGKTMIDFTQQPEVGSNDAFFYKNGIPTIGQEQQVSGVTLPETDKEITDQITKNFLSTSGNEDSADFKPNAQNITYRGPANKNKSVLDDSYTKEIADVANPYFASQYIAGASALASNFLQKAPPKKYSKNVYLDRQEVDTTPFDTAKENARDASRRSFRNLREGISQMSDLMKGVQAVSVSEQKNLAQIEAQRAQAINQNENINNQIQHRQDMLNAEKFDRDATFNWQAQSQYHKEKGQAITGSLKMLSETSGHHARHEMNELYRQKQEEVQKDYIKRQGKIDAMALKLQASKGYNETEHYQTELRKAKLNFFKSQEEKMKEKYGNDFNLGLISADFDKMENSIRVQEGLQKSRTKELQNVPEDPGELEAENPTQEQIEAHNKKLADYQTKLENWSKLEKTIETEGAKIDQARSSLSNKQKARSEYRQNLNNADIEGKFSEEYRQRYGFSTLADFDDLDELFEGE